jgi:acetyl-CoA/propionyl-CoA carboxylase biotin carboxyl carrier protein
MFKKILIANRGEIAVRVIRACQELGAAAVAIFSEADQAAKHIQIADEAWRLEGQPARVYLDIPQIIELAKRSGAEAVHPGYGFLAENGDFAIACAEAGLTFIGPRPEVIRKMGSKVEARRMMEAAGVPVVPGTIDPVDSVESVKELGTKYGYPIAIKASAGGGGRGMRVVRREEDVEQALSGAQREGASYFGNNQVYVEKYLDHPRHIEVQILADHHGNTLHLFERDCSSQRRHQKLLEESPATNLSPELRKRLLDSAVKGAASIGYTSAGTIECLVYGDDFYFLEVNTRVQVEHPVTEYITGIDIVKEQIRIACGEPLSFTQEQVIARGHAIECRINAEDPFKNFMPAPGTVSSYREPQIPWVRVDSACYSGYQIQPFYDSLLAKLVVWGSTREEAIVRTRLALKQFEIVGVPTTIAFHLQLLDDPAFQAGNVYTTYVETELKQRLVAPAPVAVAAGTDLGKSQAGPQTDASLVEVVRKGPRTFEVEVNQRQFKVAVTELVDRSNSTAVQKAEQVRAKTGPARDPRPRARSSESNGGGEIKAAMHGVVKELLVAEGDRVSTGQKLLIFEAMKMESEILSGRDGRVVSLKVKRGETVEAASVLLVVGD